MYFPLFNAELKERLNTELTEKVLPEKRFSSMEELLASITCSLRFNPEPLALRIAPSCTLQASELNQTLEMMH